MFLPPRTDERSATLRRFILGLLNCTAGALLVAASGLFASAADIPRLPEWREKMQPINPRGYVAHHTANPPVIDGKLDDAAWATAPWTENFVDIEGSARATPRFRTRAKMLWDDDHLYIAAELEEPHLWGTITQHDAVIFHDPDFEVFIDPDGDTQGYFEFEINALNTTWDLMLPKPYMDGGKARNDWEIPGLKSAVHLRGTLNRPDDTDVGWSVELAFPWSAFSDSKRPGKRPADGESWRINFSRVEWRVTTAAGAYHKVPKTPEDNWVWSPQGVIDMHRPEMWGTVLFSRDPQTTPAASPPLPGKSARDVALDFYYAQLDFHRSHRRWAETYSELSWSAPSDTAPQFHSSADGYTFSIPFAENGRSQTWTIRQDRRLTLE